MAARRLQSQTFRSKRRKRSIWVTALSILAVASCLSALSLFTKLPVLAISSVQIFGADQDIVPTLQSAAERAIQGDYLGLFSKENTFIYPRGAIVAAVRAASPRVDAVSVSHYGPHGLSISVTEKTPVALVCADLPDFSGTLLSSTTPSSCYLADASGFAYAAAPADPGHDYERYYVPDMAGIGSYATSSAEFAALHSFYGSVRRLGLDARGLLIKDGGEYELYVDQGSLSTAVIYFNDQASLSVELSNVQAFWDSMTGPGRTAGAPPRFDTIDLRYGSNVFYRLSQ